MKGEIINDKFFTYLSHLAERKNTKTILEIGSGSGSGSTQALVAGLRQGRSDQRVFCIEACPNNFAELAQSVSGLTAVRPCFGSSVHPKQIVDWKQVAEWYQQNPGNQLSQYGLATVRSWWERENDRDPKVPVSLIETIKDETGLPYFDMVLIDGSEFTGEAEFRQIYGSRWIALDDVGSFKNWKNREFLMWDEHYALWREDLGLRNGFSIFRLKKGFPSLL